MLKNQEGPDDQLQLRSVAVPLPTSLPHFTNNNPAFKIKYWPIACVRAPHCDRKIILIEPCGTAIGFGVLAIVLWTRGWNGSTARRSSHNSTASLVEAHPPGNQSLSREPLHITMSDGTCQDYHLASDFATGRAAKLGKPRQVGRRYTHVHAS